MTKTLIILAIVAAIAMVAFVVIKKTVPNPGTSSGSRPPLGVPTGINLGGPAGIFDGIANVFTALTKSTGSNSVSPSPTNYSDPAYQASHGLTTYPGTW
jgi:hypothetical protein